MIPSIGRIVHITLSDACADDITNKRKILDNTYVGNSVTGGQVYPMIITRVWSNKPSESTAVQGQIFLDGSDVYWATSVVQGTKPGQWFEAPKV